MGLGGSIAGAAPLLFTCEDNSPVIYKSAPSAPLYPVKRNTLFKLDRPETLEKLAMTYNNFGSHKNIWRASQVLPLRPWEVKLMD